MLQWLAKTKVNKQSNCLEAKQVAGVGSSDLSFDPRLEALCKTLTANSKESNCLVAKQVVGVGFSDLSFDHRLEGLCLAC